MIGHSDHILCCTEVAQDSICIMYYTIIVHHWIYISNYVVINSHRVQLKNLCEKKSSHNIGILRLSLSSLLSITATGVAS